MIVMRCTCTSIQDRIGVRCREGVTIKSLSPCMQFLSYPLGDNMVVEIETIYTLGFYTVVILVVGVAIGKFTHK